MQQRAFSQGAPPGSTGRGNAYGTHDRGTSIPNGHLGPELLTLLATILAAGTAYVLLLLDPVASSNEQYTDCVQWRMPEGCGLQLWDSLIYMRASEGLGVAELLARLADMTTNVGVTVFAFNNLGLYIQGALAHNFLPWAPQLAVFWMNFSLLCLTVYQLQRLANNVGLTANPGVIALVLLNPLTTYYALSLTKEIWGIFFVAAFARYCSEQRYLTTLALALLSVGFRSIYLPVAVGFILVTMFRIKIAWYLLAASIVLAALPLVDVEAVRTLQSVRLFRASELGTQTAAIMSVLAQVQAIPFGHVVATPVIAFIGTASPMFNPNAYQNILDVGWLANILSSYFMTIVAAAGVARYLRSRPRQVILVGRYVGMFMILVTTYPISYHRYWVPIYPLLCIWAFGLRITDSPRAPGRQPDIELASS